MAKEEGLGACRGAVSYVFEVWDAGGGDWFFELEVGLAAGRGWWR